MPDVQNTSPSSATAALSPDLDATIPRIKLGEQGFVGLKVTNGYIYESANRAFRWPAMLKVVDEMRLCPSVATALNAYRLLMNRVEWDVEVPIGASPVQLERANFIKTIMHDMDDSWQSTVASWFPYLEYGFHVSEKVYRRRLRKNGSKFQDGLVGLKKIAPRAQSSIVRWDFSDDGRDLIGVEQSLRYMDKSYLYMNQTDERGLIYVDREKFLLFRADATLGNPEGNSILKSVYLAFKQLTLLSEQEIIGVAKDVQAMLKILAPPKYFDPSANDADKAVLTGFQAIINNYNAGTQRGLLAPLILDDKGAPLFTYELMGDRGQAKYDVEAIIRRLQGDILDAMSCGILKLGMDTAGSFSLQDGDTNILTLAVSHRLQEIADVLNSDLIPQLFALNGWSDTELPKFVFHDTSSVSMEEHSKWIQRVASVGMIEVDRGVLNKVREVGGFAPKPDDEPVDKENLSTALAGKSSSAAQGMAVGVGGVNGGTSTSNVSGGDNSAANNDNKA